jgi:predicted transcriptional regulator
MTNIINMPLTDKEKDNSVLAIKILVSCVDPKMNAMELPYILKGIKATLDEIGRMENDAFKLKPANVPSIASSKELPEIVKQTVFEDYIVCLEDGAKLKMLKRHLRSKFQITAKEYIEKWNLPSDYPLVCASHSKKRSAIAKQVGLGKSGGRRKKVDPSDLPAVKLVNKRTKPIQMDIEDTLDL